MAKVIRGAPSLHSSGQRSTAATTDGAGVEAGSLEDFQTIYREHYPAIWRFLLHLGVRKSDVADVKNTGGRAAGTITAGWFLKEFAEGLRWAHLDIAGTAYTDREDAAGVKGPTGIAVRLWSEFLLARAG